MLGLLKKEEELEERRRMPNCDFFTSRGAYINLRYIAMLYTHSMEISRRTRWWCLKCVIVYLTQDIPAFVMYCVDGESGSSLLIKSTDSMICKISCKYLECGVEHEESLLNCLKAVNYYMCIRLLGCVALMHVLLNTNTFSRLSLHGMTPNN